ncbi:MAG: MBL fold metallo-hydrolase [Syntrophobacteraceae bacterium]|nr:MBL fold metallo-hydrolase [Syntrophobacteraceae bacterium]
MTMQDTGWFRTTEVEDGVFLIEDPGHVQFYLVRGEELAALVDSGMGFRNVRSAIEPLVSTPVIVLNTHWHFDHIGGNAHFERTAIGEVEKSLVARNIPNELLMDLYINPCISEGVPLPPDFNPHEYKITGVTPDFTIAHGDTFDLGGRELLAIATPGHTHGSMSFLDGAGRNLLTGDLVCEGAIYAHFWDSDLDEYIASLEHLLARRSDFDRLLVSHGPPILPPLFLESVLKGFREIQRGGMIAYPEEGWGEPVDRYAFDQFGILSKPEGSQGIRLFDWA